MGHALLRIFALVAAGWLFAKTAAGAEPPRYNRDVRPILALHCFSCHGPDHTNRKGGVRLDERAAALHAADSGSTPIVPGKPEASEVVRRIFASDPGEMMPPPSANKPLTTSQKALLKRWIAGGATYEPHWAFIVPQRIPPPAVKRSAWPRNAVDSFILSRLEQESLPPSPEAPPATLLRRLSLDLTGLPPSLADAKQFEREMAQASASDGPGGRSAADRVYSAWVERLLASPHYGERMAVDWLDAARFADSNGYQVDRDRDMHVWRDWVIAAFNADKSYDRFTIEQLAGDLLPGATRDQKIATGFHRNHMFNEESGVIPEEFLIEYCADRVETTSTVWLGLTINCARCHDHKFDPFTQRDYYSLLAYFHNLPEVGLGNAGAPIGRTAPPFLPLPAPRLEAQTAALTRDLAQAKGRLARAHAGDPDRKTLADKIAGLQKELKAVEGQIPTVLVMQELPTPRPTHILMRGAYNKPGALVTAGTPAALPPASRPVPPNRLGLAEWLVDPANPLTARVTMNRLWQSLFGVGLVRTTEDFGTQGESPTHPQLLDWLATEFPRRNWDLKAMTRLLVTSSTYRQSSRLTPLLREHDPENRLYARGPRFRLQAEFLRDQALAASGLLRAEIGGPSVKPYQPPGLYEEVVSGYTARTYVAGTGDDLFRRSLYTYWKRSVPNPGMLVFDAPFRETCVVRRPRTNTPLQALDLMNDPTYVEAARCLAQRMAHAAVRSTRERLSLGFQSLLIRPPRPAELDVLLAAYDRALADFRGDRQSAARLLQVGQSAVDKSIEPAQLAALTTVADTLLNLDEAVTKE